MEAAKKKSLCIQASQCLWGAWPNVAIEALSKTQTTSGGTEQRKNRPSFYRDRRSSKSKLFPPIEEHSLFSTGRRYPERAPVLRFSSQTKAISQDLKTRALSLFLPLQLLLACKWTSNRTEHEGPGNSQKTSSDIEEKHGNGTVIRSPIRLANTEPKKLQTHTACVLTIGT